ncbi:hypothetical protein [Neomoorella mulderi]|uniref:hypothetical protein n=1 Tax=Neomoorella mulderi TaxID=202604 RepID=UPI00137285FF|nr:hypothetical protein [Moorella mulderi]
MNFILGGNRPHPARVRASALQGHLARARQNKAGRVPVAGCHEAPRHAPLPAAYCRVLK